MARKVGLTASVIAVMSDGKWHTCGWVSNAVPEQHRKTANVILGQLWKHGRAERRGEYRAYEYRLLDVAAERARSLRDFEGLSAEAAACAGVQLPPVFAASLGTVAGELVASGPVPANRAQGRIEDVLAAVLDKHDARMLDQILPDVPNGWSRLDVISGIADGVLAGWIRARRNGARDAYLLLRDPPPVRHNPQVERFKAHRLVEQCRMLDADTRDALVAAREYDAPAELVRALVDLRRAAVRTLQQLEA
ncbi:hypothetical protein ACFONC_11790 [Luteimonas soli]|uniref:Uncharacterized protein n=1 Tax=Luteimonas soli TaxID=1648966 RepID=A0ABV7XND1_9GAMM